jgi:hypothetical protein
MSTRSRGGPPGWFIMLIAVALVFAAYYLWTGMQNYFLTGGQGVVETTQRAGVVATATAERFTQLESGMSDRTPLPTPTPIPECMDFVVIVANAIVREEPAAQGAIITQYPEGTTVCVLGRQGSTEWYVIDQEPNRRRLVLAYMHETVIRAVNPTATPTNTHTPFPTGTFTPLPTVTPVLSDTPETPVTASPIPPTPTQTPIPSETPIRQAA